MPVGSRARIGAGAAGVVATGVAPGKGVRAGGATVGTGVKTAVGAAVGGEKTRAGGEIAGTEAGGGALGVEVAVAGSTVSSLKGSDSAEEPDGRPGAGGNGVKAGSGRAVGKDTDSGGGGGGAPPNTGPRPRKSSTKPALAGGSESATVGAGSPLHRKRAIIAIVSKTKRKNATPYRTALRSQGFAQMLDPPVKNRKPPCR